MLSSSLAKCLQNLGEDGVVAGNSFCGKVKMSDENLTPTMAKVNIVTDYREYRET